MRLDLNPHRIGMRGRVAGRCLAQWLVALLLVAIAGLTLFSTVGVSARAPDGEPPEVFVPQGLPAKEGHPKLDSRLYRVAEAHKREGVSASLALGEEMDLDLVGGRVRVMVVADPEVQGEVGQAVESLGGEVETRYLDLVQALVPPDVLEALVQVPGVDYVRPPMTPRLSVVSQGVAKMGSDVWQEAGWRGDRVKVAVLDLGFSGYTGLLGSELPWSVTARSFRADGDITGGSERHGTACAEVVHDMAPGARLYLVNYSTEAEMGNAVNWLISQGVDVISHSVVWFNAGPYDGTGTICDMVTNARNNGIVWVQAAGNQAEKHYQGTFNADSFGYHLFNPPEGNINSLLPGTINVGDPITVYLSWDDWTNVDQDYDLYLRRWNGSTEEWDLVASSTDFQTGQPGHTPSEEIYTVASQSGTYGILIRKYNSTRNVYLEVYSVYNDFSTVVVASSSLAIPADSASALTVGATYWSNDNLESFSSLGPPNGSGGTGEGGSIKPDLVGPDGVQTTTPFPYNPFYGTSAATPHIAGAAAQVLDRYPAYTPSQVQSYLESHAIDLGDSGKDNLYGWGRPDLLSEYAVYWIYPRGALDDQSIQASIGGAGLTGVYSATLVRAGETDITGTSVTVVDDNEVTGTFDIISGTMPGLWNVEVTKSGGMIGGSKFLVATGNIYLPMTLNRE